MKRYVLLALLFSLLSGSSLKSLIANLDNDLLKSKDMQILSAKGAIGAIKSGYYPTVDVGAFAQSLSPKTPMRAGATYSLYAKLNYVIYDGGLKSNTIKQKRFELVSKVFEREQFKDALILQVVQDFFAIKSLNALIGATKVKKNSIKEQLFKGKKLYSAGLMGLDELARLEAALELVNYNIKSLDFQKKSFLSALSLKVGKSVKGVANSHFIKRRVGFSANSTIRAIRARALAISSSADVIKSSNSAKVNLALEHNKFAYARYDRAHPKGLNSQSKVTLSANMRLYDGGATKQKAQVAKLQAASALLEAKYKLKEQRANYKLAQLRLKSIRAKIKSAKAALKAANRLYGSVLTKYNQGLVDNSLLLDALSSKTQATAELSRAKNDLEIAYALYYYYAGKNLKGLIR